ncbi:hypothetical protein TKK_0018197 [Trichogramma kaykai]
MVELTKDEIVKIFVFVVLLPFCFGQFSIQGPSDGNRRAQGLKFTQDKGVEYTDQAESLRNDGFSIVGASDGNSNFQIQGATDGNSDFKIQGATDGNSEFQIHGPTDGGSQAYVHNYEQQQYQQPTTSKSFDYQEENGNQVHWRSYNRATEQQTQYQEPEVARPIQRRPSTRRAPQQAAVQQQQQQPQAAQPQPQYQQNPGFLGNVNYNPIEKAPPSIQEILQYQAQIPYIDIVPEKTRIEALEAAKAQAAKFAEDYPKQVLAQRPPQVIIEEAPRNQYRPKPRPRERRQTAQYQAQQDEVVYYEPQEYTVPSQEESSEHQRRQASYYETPASQEQSHLIQAHEPSAAEYYAQRSNYYAQQHQQRQLQQHQKRQQVPLNDVYQQQRQAIYLQQEQEKQEVQHQPQQQQYVKPPAAALSSYKRLSQPLSSEIQPTYSTNVPQQIQEILKFQARIPYEIVANQINIGPVKPYVPQPTQQVPQEQQVKEAPHYKPQTDYRPQTFDHDQAQVYSLKKQQLNQQQVNLQHYGQQADHGFRPLHVRQN